MEQLRIYNKPLGITIDKFPNAAQADTVNSTHIVGNENHDAHFFRSLENEGILLNKPQIEAVRHVDGPFLALAGAGSGKTSVLVCRTGYLVKVQNVDPKQILLVTFSKKAADEMKGRIAELSGLNRHLSNSVQVSTFHSFFLTLLRSRGYSNEIISSDRHRQIILKRLMKEMGISESYQPETLLTLFSYFKVNMLTKEKLAERPDTDKKVMEIYLRYEEWKEKNHKFDFDDILVQAYALLHSKPQLLSLLQNRFQYVMVDEFQDTNLLQYELIKILTHSHQNLFVVGDDDQTIYSFNGARSEFILNFEKEYDCSKTVTLDINYRSTSPIVGLGNEIIKQNEFRKQKHLKSFSNPSTEQPSYLRPSTTDEEANWLVSDIKEKLSKGTHILKDFAILHRTSSNSRAIFEQLVLEGIPFIHYSMNNNLFYEHWAIKPIIDHLKLTINPREFDAMDAVVPTLFISREKGMNFIWNMELKTTKKYPLIHLTSLPGIRTFQAEKVKERIRFLKEIKETEPCQAIKQIRTSFYEKFLETENKHETTMQKEELKEILDELEASAKRFKTIPTFISFIDEMVEHHKMLNQSNKQSEQNVVSLMTIHRAKGLEFKTVYLIGASEGILPHSTALEANKLDSLVSTTNKRLTIQLALEEERRLAYVAVTRAKQELYISSPAYYRGKKTDISRFLIEAFSPEQAKSARQMVKAWVCANDICNVWQRITNEQEELVSKKNCPVCKVNMVIGDKVI
jgi:DNA helicase II / ATP-dependent DNA helicase PcrA